MEAELLTARCAVLDHTLAAGYTTVNWLSLTVQQFVKSCDEVCNIDGRHQVFCTVSASGPAAVMNAPHVLVQGQHLPTRRCICFAAGCLQTKR